MNFEHSFQRTVNGSGTALGSDVALVTGANTSAPAQFASLGAFGAYKCISTASGQSPTKLLISVVGPAAANAMSANVYIWNEKSNSWLLWSANVACANGALTSVAMPSPTLQRGQPQSLEYCVAFASVATPNGTYFFDISPGL